MRSSKILNLVIKDWNLFRISDFGFRISFRRSSTIFAFMAVMMTTPLPIRAQETDTPPTLNRAAQYFLGDKDEILISINIWGFVRKPGQYLVPRHTDLISLMSFAGGPIDGAKLSEVRIIRDATRYAGKNGDNAKNGKNGKQPRQAVVNVDVKRFIETGRGGLIPPLQAGDTIVIKESSGHKFRNFLGFSSIIGILAAGASIAVIIDRVAR